MWGEARKEKIIGWWKRDSSLCSTSALPLGSPGITRIFSETLTITRFKWLEKPNFHNRRSTTCGQTNTHTSAWKAGQNILVKSCLSGSFRYAFTPQAAGLRLWKSSPKGLKSNSIRNTTAWKAIITENSPMSRLYVESNNG